MIEFELDPRSVRQVERRLGELRSKTPQVLKNAVNATARQARKDLATKARQVYTVKIGGFNREMKIRNATAANIEATIKATGANLEMKKFSVYGGRGGSPLSVLINRHNGRKNVLKPGAFVNNIARKGQTRKRDTAKGAKGTQVRHVDAAYRETEKRLPIHKLFSVSVPHMIGSERDVYGVVEPKIREHLQENVEKQIARTLRR